MEEVVQIKTADVLKAYRDGDASNKKLLENMLPAMFGNVMEQITCFEDICRIAGENPADYEMPANPTKRQIKAIALARIELAAEVVHNGKDVDWDDFSTTKYEPVFRFTEKGVSGFGFSFTYTYYDYTSAYVSSRFADKGKCEFVAKLLLLDYYRAITGKID